LTVPKQKNLSIKNTVLKRRNEMPSPDDFLFEHFGKPEFPEEEFVPKKHPGKFEKPIEGSMSDKIYNDYVIDLNTMTQENFLKKYCR
jgi:hypothetical protein